MSRQPTQKKDGPPLPDQKHIVHLLKQYGEALMEPCPSSENLVLFSENPSQLSSHELEAIEGHVKICLDCRDKLLWLTGSEEYHTEIQQSTGSNFMMVVHHPASDQVTEAAPMAYAAQSHFQVVDELPAVPYITDEDGSIYGEIGQDLDHQLFLSLTRLPRAYQWHALEIRAFTFDQQVIKSKGKTITEPKFELACRSNVQPEDLERIELRFIPLRQK